jgi:L-ascorbate metabolism protein UlaG (beta-lactamase superfamily)
MSSRFLCALLLGSLLTVGVSCTEPESGQAVPDESAGAPTPLEVTYIANEGFLISAGSSKVLIDALHENPWAYENTPEDALAAMSAGEPPFDGVDLLIASHHHADHFSAHLAHPYLAQHPEVTFISSQNAVDTLAEFAGDGYESIAGQVRNVNPEWGSSEEVMVDGITVRLLTLNHAGPDREEGPVLTLGSLVKLGGRAILHLADMVDVTTADYLVGYGLAGEEIDVLFLDHFFLLGEIGPDLVRDHINPKQIVMMHLRPEERGEVRQQVQAIFPEAVVFDMPMETRVFD